MFNPDLKCFTAVGEETWNELHGLLSKGMQVATAIRAGHNFVHRRLVSQRDHRWAGPTEIWDARPHAGKGGKGTMAQAVWKL